VDCSLPGIPTLSTGFPANSLTDPEPPPLFFSLDPKLVTPYMQQWHLSAQYELPSNTVFELTYAGLRGLKQYIYLAIRLRRIPIRICLLRTGALCPSATDLLAGSARRAFRTTTRCKPGSRSASLVA
jgi:hypothetical protein